MTNNQLRDEIRCRCPACLEPRDIPKACSSTTNVTCSKCGKALEFRTWEGFWQIEEERRQLRKLEAIRETARKWNRLLVVLGIPVVLACVSASAVALSVLLRFGLEGWAYFVIFLVALFAGCYYGSVIARDRWFDTKHFTWLAVSIPESIGAVGIFYAVAYGPLKLLVLLGAIMYVGAIPFFIKVRTDETERAVQGQGQTPAGANMGDTPVGQMGSTYQFSDDIRSVLRFFRDGDANGEGGDGDGDSS